MAYTPTTWVNGVTAINATRLNNIEGGVDATDQGLTDLEADLAAHLADTTDAHDASAISVADAGTFYTATTVEGVLQEIAPNIGAPVIANLFDDTLASDQANFDVTSIPGTYTFLRFVLTGRGATAAAEVAVRIRMNNDSGNNYEYQRLFSHSGNNQSGADGSAQSSGLVGELAADSATAGRAGTFEGVIHNYAGTTYNKVYYMNGGRVASLHLVESVVGAWLSTSAITRLTFFPASGDFKAGTRLTVWGVA